MGTTDADYDFPLSIDYMTDRSMEIVTQALREQLGVVIIPHDLAWQVTAHDTVEHSCSLRVQQPLNGKFMVAAINSQSADNMFTVIVRRFRPNQDEYGEIKFSQRARNDANPDYETNIDWISRHGTCSNGAIPEIVRFVHMFLANGG